MEWKILGYYQHFILWENVKLKYRECFRYEENPNDLAREQELKSRKMSYAQKNAKRTKRKDPAWS